MNLHLGNKLALVSGSTKGIGFAIALGLAREGARVIVNGRSQKSVDEALALLRKEHPTQSSKASPATCRGARTSMRSSRAIRRWTCW